MGDVMVQGNKGLQLLQSLTPELPAGLAGFSSRQLGLQPMELRIIHSIKGQNETGRPGDLRFGAETLKETEVVFLKAHPYRTLMEGPDKDRPKTTCASLDCVTPLAEIDYPKAATCAECAYGQWDTGPTGKRIPPACAEGIAFLGLRLDVSEPKPFWFLCRKTAQRAAKDFLTEIIHDSEIMALHQCRVRITTKQNKEGGLIWYTPTFTIVRPLMSPGEYSELAAAVADVWFTPRVDLGAGAPMDVTEAANNNPPPLTSGGGDTWENLM